MKRHIAITVLLILSLSLSLLVLAGCGGNDTNANGKQVPIYQGMTITHVNTATTGLEYMSDRPVLFNGNNGNENGNNGNHYGHYKGDCKDQDDTVDGENPYPDNAENETIEEEIRSSLHVVGAYDPIYYAAPNQDIYINIHINNPDDFEILSFTLNGKKYSSYMFEEGSDMETIVLKYNVGAASGIVEYTIDAIKYVDGSDIKDVIIDGDQTVTVGIKTENQVTADVSNVNVGTNVLSFDVVLQDRDALVAFSKGALKAVLYDGDAIVAETDLTLGDNSVSFKGLSPHTLYQYAIVGYYDDLSGNGFQMNVLYKEALYTNAVVLFDNIAIGKETVDFTFFWCENPQGGAISALMLYRNGTLVKEISADATTVDGLLSGATYTLVAEYPNSEKTESISLEFTTVAKTAPTFTVRDEAITTDSIRAEYDISDADGALTQYTVELYSGSTLVLNNADKQINFAGLLSYSDYTVRFTYTYDLNNGNGEQTATYDHACKTLPYIDVVEFDITNTAAVFEGEMIYVTVQLDNPLGLHVSSVAINGAVYEVTRAQAAGTVFVEIPCNDQFPGGNTLLKIDKLYATNGSGSFAVTPKAERSDSIYIEKKLQALKIEIVNEKFEQIEWVFPSEKAYILVTLDNPTGYTVESIKISGTDVTSITKLDNNRWYCDASFLSTGTNILSLDSIRYHGEHSERHTTYFGIKSNAVYQIKSNKIVYISTPNDLKNMNGGYYYELKNDIDLSGIEWTGASFSGIFDGKGYTIKNMSFNGSIQGDKYMYLGLFATGNGYIRNVNIKGANMVAEITLSESQASTISTVVAGLLVGCSMNNGHPSCVLNIQNCTVDETSVLAITTKNYPHTFVGGLVGYSAVCTAVFNNCVNNGTVGYAGNVGNAGNVGGLIGGGMADITNCINNGTVTSTADAVDTTAVGGLFGQGSVSIANCINSGTVTGTENVGELCGASGRVTNSYSLKGDGGQNGELCTVEQLNSKEFYVQTLGWSEEIWDFSDLDVENGKYPKLK